MIQRGLWGALILLAMFALPRLSWVLNLDFLGLGWMVEHRSAFASHFYIFMSQLGEPYGLIVILVLPGLIHLLKHRWKNALLCLLGIGLLKLSILPLKILTDRARPTGGMIILPTLSMPSGHAFDGMCLGILGIILAKKISSPWLRYLGYGFSVFLAGAIGLSRVYLGVHFPSDVVMGWLYAAWGLWFMQGLRKDLFSF